MLEDILAEELKQEMRISTGSKFRYVDNWDDVMHSIYELPVEYDGYVKKVSEMQYVREMIDILYGGDFENVKRSESRRKQLKSLGRNMHMYYNLIFSKKNERIGFGALIHFPKLEEKSPERSGGVVLMARYVEKDGKGSITYEKARFDDFLVEVKPFVEILGNLYRRTRQL